MDKSKVHCNTQGDMYRSDRGPVWMVHTILLVCPTVSCVDTSVQTVPIVGRYTDMDQ